MVKVVYNQSFGGFSISKKCAEWMASRGNQEAAEMLEYKTFHGYYDGPRHDPLLVMAIEELGEEESSGDMSRLAIKRLEGKKYFIREYDGSETVIEPQDVNWIEV